MYSLLEKASWANFETSHFFYSKVLGGSFNGSFYQHKLVDF